MLFRTLCSLLFAVVLTTSLFSQSRDFRTGRIILDDNGGGGTFNTLTISLPADLPGNRVLTIPDPGPGGGEFLLSNAGTLNVTEIETPNVNETLRLNPSGDLVQIGNSATPGTSNGLQVYGNVSMTGSNIAMSNTAGSAGATIGSQDVAIQGREIVLQVTETVTINGNLVVNGNVQVGGNLRVFGSFSQIGSGANTEQLRVNGAPAGTADHLFVVGNVRLTNQLRIGSGSNTSIFRTGSQPAQITYTLPTTVPAAAGTASSMGAGIMETTNTGAMSWRNSGTGSAALDFPSTNDGATSDLTLTVTGATVGDMVILGIPNGAQPAGSAWYQAWVSAANTVTVRLYNESGAAVDPGSDTFNVMVLRP
ncbi:MAG: hypothetical protein KDD67_17015 [Ignavibacteriae bacterium]|nr:hypothetical protein [Ignavibacteriota bacterium]